MSNKRIKKILKEEYNFQELEHLFNKQNEVKNEIRKLNLKLEQIKNSISYKSNPINEFNEKRNKKTLNNLIKHLYNIKENKYLFFIFKERYDYNNNKRYFYINIVTFRMDKYEVIIHKHKIDVNHSRFKNVLNGIIKSHKYKLNNVKQDRLLKQRFNIIKATIITDNLWG